MESSRASPFQRLPQLTDLRPVGLRPRFASGKRTARRFEEVYEREGAGLADALLFCTRDRLVRVGGVYGLEPVKHGAQRITGGTRFVLGVPFHEYR